MDSGSLKKDVHNVQTPTTTDGNMHSDHTTTIQSVEKFSARREAEDTTPALDLDLGL